MNQTGGGSGTVGTLGGVISIGLLLYGLFSGNEKESNKPEEKLELNNYDRTASVPLIYGTDKVTGTCIYLGNISIDKVIYGGKGFGGPETEVWMYYADFAVAFGEGTIDEFITYELGESGSNPGGSLSIEEFLGTPNQLKSTIIDLNYNVKNTAYLAFSGTVGTSNILPNITAIISGIDTAIEESFSMHWNFQDPMCYQFPELTGYYFSDQDYIYWIDPRDGSIYKYNDIDNSKTLVCQPGEVCSDFETFATYTTEDGEKVYCFTGRNLEIQGTLFEKVFYYNYFYLENGIFTSIKLNELIECNWEMEEFGFSIYSYEPLSNRIYINGTPAIQYQGFKGQFFCECNGTREVYGGSACFIGYDSIVGKWYVDMTFFPNLYGLSQPTTIQSIRIFNNLTYFGYKLNLPGTTGTYINNIVVRGIIIINNILYVYGYISDGGSHSRAFIEIFNKNTGEHNGIIFTIFVYAFEFMYTGIMDITATHLGDELVFGIIGRENDKGTQFNFQYNFFMIDTNINTFSGKFTETTNGKIVLGCKKFNDKYFFLYIDISSSETKQYLYMYSDNSQGFGGWNDILYRTKVWEISTTHSNIYFYYNTERNPSTGLCVYNDRLYFRKIMIYRLDNANRSYFYLTKSGILVDEAITVDAQQSGINQQFYLISCKQRAVDSTLNCYDDSFRYTRILDFKPSIATPISVLYDFLTNEKYGVGIPITQIDGPISDETTSFGSEHAYCLEVINVENNWDWRFLYAQAITQRKKGFDIIKDILKTCRGFIYFCDGKIKVQIEKPDEEPVIYFGYHKETLVSRSY